FKMPRGIYSHREKNKTILYSANEGDYKKSQELLVLRGEVDVVSDEARYLAQEMKYFFAKDLIVGTGDVKFMGDDLKTRDHIIITSRAMTANPEAKKSHFTGNVKGELQRKKKYEGKMDFS